MGREELEADEEERFELVMIDLYNTLLAKIKS